MLDEALGIRIIFRPEMNKLSKMMRTQDGPITSEVVKVVHDDSNEQVENQEGADNEEADEEWIGNIGSTTFWFTSIIRLWITDCSLADKLIN